MKNLMKLQNMSQTRKNTKLQMLILRIKWQNANTTEWKRKEEILGGVKNI